MTDIIDSYSTVNVDSYAALGYTGTFPLNAGGRMQCFTVSRDSVLKTVELYGGYLDKDILK